ncbi:hypothetical protein EXN22_16290 [Pseudomonas tructae]|uniref:Uncharacterized protein n=1 Tax=Pseudomonas tructae TaxID=2518644 RepID=A0A411MK36_9PSED|nr:hypothetical protein [Pseudomonas tructae]QBF27174.1 hypothetical protein EXN22_16290 [Pseudomonas tructae]
MKLISARQAWREALHENRDSVLAVAAERVKLGKRGRVLGETTASGRDSNGRCAHMLAAGLVQKAIGTLPKPLQHFGHALYSPIAGGQDLNIAHALVWFTADIEKIPVRRREAAYWMALAAIRSHQASVSGREAWGPGRISEFVYDWYGATITVSQWARDWSAVWEVLAKTCDSLDAQALRPVAAVVARLKERRHVPGDCRWDVLDREEVADARGQAYAERREPCILRLRARLNAMHEQALRHWFARMRDYTRAYREEWGSDIIENQARHAQFSDRVAEYWNQRHRIGDVQKRVA